MTGSIFEAENGEISGALGKGEDHGAVASLKRSFREPVLSPVLDHGFSYVGVFAPRLRVTFPANWELSATLDLGEVAPLLVLLERVGSFNALSWHSTHIVPMDIMGQRF